MASTTAMPHPALFDEESELGLLMTVAIGIEYEMDNETHYTQCYLKPR